MAGINITIESTSDWTTLTITDGASTWGLGTQVDFGAQTTLLHFTPPLPSCVLTPTVITLGQFPGNSSDTTLILHVQVFSTAQILKFECRKGAAGKVTISSPTDSRVLEGAIVDQKFDLGLI
jgi:hypothetical protein